MKSFLNNHTVRGLRNNNPGNLVKTNIKWLGKLQSTDPKFEQFQSLEFGIRAQLKDLINDINKGKNTVSALISEYAPPNENNTGAYIRSVAKSLGVTEKQKLTSIDAKFMLNLARAIYKVELGKYHVDIKDSDILGAISKLGEVSTGLLKVNTNTNFFF